MNDQENQTIMLFGTFDHLHAGHENLFLQAKALSKRFANPIIVTVIARDKTVKQIKGRKPDNNEKTRQKNLEETTWSNAVILGEKKDKTKAIKNFRPSIIALGYDQFAFTQNLEKLIIDLNLDTKIVRLKPYQPGIYKSSLIREKHASLKSSSPNEKSLPIKHFESVSK